MKMLVEENETLQQIVNDNRLNIHKRNKNLSIWKASKNFKN